MVAVRARIRAPIATTAAAVSLHRRCTSERASVGMPHTATSTPASSDDEMDGGGPGSCDVDRDTSWMASSRERTAQVLQARKALKRKMALAAAKFNSDAKDWIEFAQDLEWVAVGVLVVVVLGRCHSCAS